MARFSFDFDPLYRVLSAPFGVTAQTSMVEVSASRLLVRFGPWVIDTPLTNVAGVEVTGPYSIWKTAGPARLSIVDRGLTMATNRRRGLCIRFRAPVRGIDPFGWVRHPGLTVTVDEIEDLRSALDQWVGERELGEMGVGVPGETPRAVVARVARWPVGMVFAGGRYLRLRTSGAVVRSFETSIGSSPLADFQSTNDDVQRIEAGDGAMYERIFRVTVRNSQLTPPQLLDRIASDLNRVSPPEVAEFVSQTSDTGEAQPQEEFMVRMPGPWQAPVRCIERTPTSLRLATLPGHMEAGQIEFCTGWAETPTAMGERSRSVTFQVRSVARSRGRAYRLIYDRLRLASEMQWYMWVRVCQRVAELAGGLPDGPVEVRTIRHEG